MIDERAESEDDDLGNGMESYIIQYILKKVKFEVINKFKNSW